MLFTFTLYVLYSKTTYTLCILIGCAKISKCIFRTSLACCCLACSLSFISVWKRRISSETLQQIQKSYFGFCLGYLCNISYLGHTEVHSELHNTQQSDSYEYRGRILGRNPDKIFLLAIHSHLPGDFYFFKLTQPLTVSTVRYCKGERRKIIENHTKSIQKP